MEAIIKKIDMFVGADGAVLQITVTKAAAELSDKAVAEIKNGKIYDLVIKQHKEKRSLNANAYCWKLIGEIGKALRTEDPKKTDNDIYRDYIREAGVSCIVAINEKVVEQFKRGWLDPERIGNMVEDLGEYIQNGVKGRNLKVYEGSSTYDKKSMARMIDRIVEDAKSLGIETITPQKLEAIKDRWGNEKI